MKEMKAIETFNNTDSELKRTVNMAFECILQRIEEVSKIGRTYIQQDFQSAEIKDGVRYYLEEKGYLCISLYDSTLYVTWDIHVMRVAYVTYKEYKEYRESAMLSKSMEVDTDKCSRS